MKKLIMIAFMLLASLSYTAGDASVDITATLEVIEMLNVEFTDTNLNFGTVVAVAGSYDTLDTIDVTGESSTFGAYIQLPIQVDITSIEGEKISVTTVINSVTNGTPALDGTNHIIKSTPGAAPNMGVNISGNMVLAGTELPGTYIGTMNVIAKYE